MNKLVMDRSMANNELTCRMMYNCYKLDGGISKVEIV